MTGLPAALLFALLAQSPSPWSASVGTEARVESLKYHFDNPSSFGTPEPVPHFFEQTYDTDHAWLVAKVGHPLGKFRASLAAGLTATATRRADDFDTFFQPDGNVVSAGTTGDASSRAWSVSERIETARRGPLRIGIAYSFRLDRAHFHDGDGVTTMTIPPSITHRLVTSRETTVSQVHALSWFGDLVRRVGPRDTIEAGVDASPAVLAQLTVDLPDKYPGQLLVFRAGLASVNGQATWRHTWARWSLTAGAGAGRTLNWRRTSRLEARALYGTFGLTRRIP